MKKIPSILTSDSDFYKRLFRLAVPITVQYIISSLLNFLDVFMVGRLGEYELAAVGIVSQLFFVFRLLMWGFASGAAVLTAQYWGKRDIEKIKSLLGISLVSISLISLIFGLISLIFPIELISIFTNDPNVQLIGKEYCQLIGISQIFLGFAMPYSVIMGSTENAKMPMIATIIALVFDTVISYCLIFGISFFPELGIIGTGIGTLSGRIFQLGLLLVFSYSFKLPTAAKFRELFSFSKIITRKFIIIAAPVILQNLLWSAGSVTYSIIYARISTESIAAFNIAVSVETICLLFISGIGNSASIMIGNRIGANEEKKAENYAKKFLVIVYIVSFIIMIIFLSIKDSLVNYYNVSPLVKSYASNIILVMALINWAKATNIIFLSGILKGGGDTRFIMLVDIFGVWFIGVPIGFITAFVFGLPIYLVLNFIVLEEIVKMIIAYKRFYSKKWIKDVTKSPEEKKKVILE